MSCFPTERQMGRLSVLYPVMLALPIQAKGKQASLAKPWHQWELGEPAHGAGLAELWVA